MTSFLSKTSVSLCREEWSQRCRTVRSIVLFMCEALITWQINAASQPVTQIQDQRWRHDRVSFTIPTPLHSEERHLIFNGYSPVPWWDLRPAVLSDRHLNTFLSRCYGHRGMRERTLMMLPQKNKEIKVAVRMNEPSESLPSLYFSLASALSLASKYQTVMAYLRDKKDKQYQITDDLFRQSEIVMYLQWCCGIFRYKVTISK